MIFHNLGKLSFAINLYSRIINKKKDCVQIWIKRIILQDIKYSDILNTIINKNGIHSAAAFFFVFEFTEHRKSHHIYI